MSASSRVLPLLLAFLLGASILAIQPAGGYPVSPTQEALVDATMNDSLAPYGQWAVKPGQTNFYLHSGATSTVSPAPGGPPLPFVAGGSFLDGTMNAERPLVELNSPTIGGAPITQADATADPDPNDKQVLIATPDYLDYTIGVASPAAQKALFVLEAPPEDDVRIYKALITVYAACDVHGLDPYNSAFGGDDFENFGILAVVRKQTFTDGAWADTRTLFDGLLTPGTSSFAELELSGQIQDYSREFTIDSENTGSSGGADALFALNDGPVFQPNKHRFTLELKLPEAIDNDPLFTEYPGFGCFVHYDSASFPSRLRFDDDATRLGAFTEDVDGGQTSGFPRGSQADAANRRVVVQAFQANAWPGGATQMLEENVKVRVYNSTGNKYAYYVEDFGSAQNTAGQLEQNIREFDLVATTVEQLSPTLVQRTFTLSYPATVLTGSYEPQLYNRGAPHKPVSWSEGVTPINIGLRGLTLARAPGELASHAINPGEPTEFAFLLVNTGNEDDQVNIGVNDPGAGWTAEVEGGGLYFLPPGGKAIGHVLLTPSPTAVAGVSRNVVVTAGSSFSDVTDPPSVTFTADVVEGVVPGIDVSTTLSQLTIRPGETKTIDVAVANRGTARDSFVIIPSFPANVQGWTIIATPASLQVLAGSVENVQLRVKAPADAASGMSFPLGLSGQQVGDATVQDRIDVTVAVLALEGLLVDVFDGVNRTLREDRELCQGGFVGDALTTVDNPPILIAGNDCQRTGQPAPVPGGPTSGPINRHVADTDSDNGALFRIDVNNVGDVADRYKITGLWDTAPGPEGMADGDGCDGDPQGSSSTNGPDGIPDGWRFLFGEEVGGEMPAARQVGVGQHQGSGFSGIYTLASAEEPIVVPPRTTLPVFVEVGYSLVPVGGTACPADNDFGQKIPSSASNSAARFMVTVESLEDPTRQMTVPLGVKIDSAGTFQAENDFSGGTHRGVPVLAPNQANLLPANVARPAVFNLTITNQGNEHDDLEVDVSDAPADWRHDLVVTSSVPDGKTCTLPDAGGSFVCSDMGVYDEIHLQIVATPSARVPIGQRSPITVTVTSGDEAGISRSLLVTARAAGTFDFAIAPLGATTRNVQPGQTVAFPFTIDNQGTEGDTYSVTIIRGEVGEWKAVVSTSTGLFVPALHEVSGFVTMTAPSTAAAGDTDVFRVQVESMSPSGTKKTLEFSPRVVSASPLTVFGKEGQDVLIPTRGVAKTVNITSVQVSGTAASPVTFTVDEDSLPFGWEVDRTSAVVPANADSSGRPTATAPFKVTAPSNALGTSRAILRVTATAGTLTGFTDVNLNLASTFGLNLTVEEPQLVIAPGGFALYNLTVRNLGLGQDVVRFSNTALPEGWTRSFSPASMTLGPLETQTATLKLGAPTTANPGDVASILIFAASGSDTTQFSSLALAAVIGFNAMTAELVDDTVPQASPQETVTQVFNVTNTGTLPDEIRVQAVLDTIGQAANLKYSGGPETFKLNPGESAEITLNSALGPNIPSGILVQTTVRFTSLLDERPVAQRAGTNVTVTFDVLDYQFADVNGDGLRDYAVDRNDDDIDGFEQFQASTTPGGNPLASADLVRFLRDDVRAGFERDVTLPDGTTARVVVMDGRAADCNQPAPTTAGRIDGDCDGLADHFLDGDTDGQPDYYWDPDANKAAPIDFRKDVNGDQVPESFVDVDGDGRIDSVYDLTRAEFTDVVQIDVDGDGVLDYVVDRDGDGNVDQDETVLYTRDGILLIVQKVDVDGDGRLDQVFDTNGDGNPDYFIPDGSTGSVPIVMRDVNGDGTQDWTFDGDNDGRRESYYDPVTGRAHVIDAAGHFMDAMREYWYIGALFAVVLVLFVALVLVTRK